MRPTFSQTGTPFSTTLEMSIRQAELRQRIPPAAATAMSQFVVSLLNVGSDSILKIFRIILVVSAGIEAQLPDLHMSIQLGGIHVDKRLNRSGRRIQLHLAAVVKGVAVMKQYQPGGTRNSPDLHPAPETGIFSQQDLFEAVTGAVVILEILEPIRTVCRGAGRFHLVIRAKEQFHGLVIGPVIGRPAGPGRTFYI